MKFDVQLGLIESIDLPGEWQPAVFKDGGGRTYELFNCIDDSTLYFGYELRLLPLAKPVSEHFQKVLYAPFHTLDSFELDGLSAVIEALNDPLHFAINDAATDYLDKHRVIKISARSLQRDQTTMYFFLDVNGHGEIIQSLFFRTTTGLFATSASIGETILKGIIWRHAD